jgi:hypothetical protein
MDALYCKAEANRRDLPVGPKPLAKNGLVLDWLRDIGVVVFVQQVCRPRLQRPQINFDRTECE